MRWLRREEIGKQDLKHIRQKFRSYLLAKKKNTKNYKSININKKTNTTKIRLKKKKLMKKKKAFFPNLKFFLRISIKMLI